MSIKNRLGSFIRGWFPKEPKTPSKLNLAQTKTSQTKSWLSKNLFLLIISFLVLIVLQVTLYLLAYVELFTLFSGVIVIFLTIPLFYTIEHVQTRYRKAKNVQSLNKIAFIVGPACLAVGGALFLLAFISLITGVAAVTYLGSLGAIFIMYIIAPITGACIGYWMGKKRNFMPYV